MLHSIVHTFTVMLFVDVMLHTEFVCLFVCYQRCIQTAKLILVKILT